MGVSPGYTYGQKEILTLYLTTYINITSRWHVDPKRKAKIIELLEENIGEHLQDLKVVKELQRS